MFTNQPSRTYKITLPISTSKEVTEWFDIMENNNKLADLIVELVNDSIKSGISYENLNLNSSTEGFNKIEDSQNNSSLGQDDFFENLYNWKNSNNAIFKEDKKEKKKMLAI